MTIEEDKITGIWRCDFEENYIDFNIRDNIGEIGNSISFFTIHTKSEAKINFEWQAKITFEDTEGGTVKINTNDILVSEQESKFNELEIWSIDYDNKEMVIRNRDGENFIFNKLPR